MILLCLHLILALLRLLNRFDWIGLLDLCLLQWFRFVSVVVLVFVGDLLL